MKDRRPLKVKIAEILLVIFLCSIVFGVAFVMSSGSVCDTPWGARDMRCIGHFR